MKECVALLVLAVTAVGCGSGFEVVRLREPATASAGGLRVQVRQLQISDDVASDGLSDDSEIVAELTVANLGHSDYVLRPSELTWRMAIDARAPGETRSLPSAWGGEGTFDGADGDGGYHLKWQPVVVAPGQTRSYWVVFPGYDFAGDNIPRRITLALPDPAGRRLELTLADPANGFARWEVEAPPSIWMLGVQTHAMYGAHLRAMATSAQMSRVAQIGRWRWDVGFASRLLAQLEGELASTTSAFTGLAINAHISTPLWAGGRPDSPIEVGVYVGGEAQMLIALQRGDESAAMPPAIYGGFGGELGLELGLGAVRRAATPFPLTPVGKPLPLLVSRLGYTHWWIGNGHSDGYTGGFRLAW
jgi:hypothetical protein